MASHWQLMMALMIALTLLIGNITAVYQQSVKRMLAYSSIAQAGFMLFAVFSTNQTAWDGMMLYSVAYTLSTLGIFAVLIKMKDYTYDGFKGLGKKEPVLAATATICLLSLAGIPLTGGFFAKYFVLNAAMEQGLWIALIIFAVLMAAVSAYYYFKVIMSMYFYEGDAELTEESTAVEKTLMIVNAVLIILLGVMPGLILNH
jgi:NADH-quinone oxidoreductase subunit N